MPTSSISDENSKAGGISWEPRKHGNCKKGYLLTYLPRGYQKIIAFCLGSSLLKAQRLDSESSLNIGAKSEEGANRVIQRIPQLVSPRTVVEAPPGLLIG